MMTEMQLDLQPVSRTRIKWISLLLKILALVLSIAFGLLGWRVINIQVQQRGLQAELAALSAAGRPTDAAGVKRLHVEHTSDELTEAWLALFAELSDPELRKAAAMLPFVGTLEGEANQVPPRGEDWESDADARKFLSLTKAVRDRLRRLTVKSLAVYFPMQYEGVSSGSSQAHDGVKFATQFLYFEALAALRYDAITAAIDDVRCLFALAGLLNGEPSAMSVAVCAGPERAAMEVIKLAVEQRSLTEPQLVSLLDVVRVRQLANEHFQLAVQGERGMLLTTLDSFANRQGPLRYVFGSPGARTVTLKLLARLEAAPVDDIQDFMSQCSSVQGDIEEFGFGNRSSADDLAPTALIPLTARGNIIVSGEMQRRLATLAVATQLYRAKHGKLPADISEVAAVGIDPAKLVPVGGKPFGYRVNEDRSSGVLWGFSLLTRTKQTPDEPPNVDDGMELNRAWVWQL